MVTLNNVASGVLACYELLHGIEDLEEGSHVIVKHSVFVLLVTQNIPSPSTTLGLQFLLAISSQVLWRILTRQ